MLLSDKDIHPWLTDFAVCPYCSVQNLLRDRFVVCQCINLGNNQLLVSQICKKKWKCPKAQKKNIGKSCGAGIFWKIFPRTALSGYFLKVFPSFSWFLCKIFLFQRVAKEGGPRDLIKRLCRLLKERFIANRFPSVSMRMTALIIESIALSIRINWFSFQGLLWTL